MDRLMLKSDAKEMIRGKIGVLFLIGIIVFGISFLSQSVLSFIPIIGGIIYVVFVESAFCLSIVMVYLNVAKGIKPVAGDAFNGFYDFWSAFKVSFLQVFFCTLWSLLFIVPGIVKWYSYSQAMYILAENKGMPALEAIRRSKEMMAGRRMDLFVLNLSFIGWGLLTAFTFGLAGIWAIPYMQTTYANFYNSIKPVQVSGEVSEDIVPPELTDGE